METESKLSHAEQNAKAWYGTICELVIALDADRDRLEELRDERDGWTLDTEHEIEDPANDIETPDGTTPRGKAWAEANPDDAEELAELTADVTVDGEELDEEQVRERIQEGPLSVQVRSGWADVGAEMEAQDFEILLTTGGPACRIRGELGQGNEPARAWLEYQDWGTPWTQYFDAEQETLLSYCRQFYFGE